jgi:hypothetical protein
MPDDSLAIFRPDTRAEAHYRLRMKRGGHATMQANNLKRFRRSQDWTDVPSLLTVYGATWGGELAKASVYAKVQNDAVQKAFERTGHFNRPVDKVQNQIRTGSQAIRKAHYELTKLRARMDSWELAVDGLSFWDGSGLVRWAPTAICAVDCDVAGGPTGNYFIHRVRLRRDDGGSVAQITATHVDLLEFGTGP